MDVLVLIDKLDDLVHNAKAVPLTDQVRIDREEIYDILDQMRATIPEEIKQARWIVKERQEMLAEAKRETDRLLGEAREQAVREASQTEIVKLAERQAQDIVEDTRRQARETRRVLANQRRAAGRRASLMARTREDAARPAQEPPEAPSVLRALDRVSARDREILLLIAWDGLSIEEAAHALGCSRGAAKVRFHRAKRRLGQAIAELEPEDVPAPARLRLETR